MVMHVQGTGQPQVAPFGPHGLQTPYLITTHTIPHRLTLHTTPHRITADETKPLGPMTPSGPDTRPRHSPARAALSRWFAGASNSHRGLQAIGGLRATQLIKWNT